jgi:hypothetical protein
MAIRITSLYISISNAVRMAAALAAVKR